MPEGIRSTRMGDLPAEEYRRHAAAVTEWIARFLETRERIPVVARVAPGAVRDAVAQSPPIRPEPLEAVLADFQEIILPALTHWNHPSFLAYFSSSGSVTGILAETLTAALNVNAMMWRGCPAAVELEEVTVDWVRQLLGLPASFRGLITEGGSTSTFQALAAAREAAYPEARTRGLRGAPGIAVYCSEEAHSSVEKAAIALGLGLDAVRRIPTDPALRLDPEALRNAMAEDRARGARPMAVVATVGTTSTGAVDPVAAVAGIAREAGAWLHVDACYGGSAALVPELSWILEGCDRADSLVVNPHKWMFVPLDCSVLLTTRMDLLRRAFSLVPAYLESDVGDRGWNPMEYGLALGRRFRALKLWMALRSFGVEGLRSRIAEHVRLARLLAEWIDAEPDFERMAPVGLSVVVFRNRPSGLDDEDAIAALNARILERVDAGGRAFLGTTRVRGRLALRIAIGHVATGESHVRAAWDVVRAAAR